MKVSRARWGLGALAVAAVVSACAPEPKLEVVEVQLQFTSALSNLKQIVVHSGDAICPSISPDGTKLAYIADSEPPDSTSRNWDIYVMDGSGGAIKVTEDKELIWDQNPVWASDDKVAFDSDNLGSLNIWMKPYAGGALQKLTGAFPHAFSPSVSPDGSKIAYVLGGYNNKNNDVIPYNQLLNSYYVSPKQLDTFIADWYYQGETKAPQVWIMDLKGGAPLLLTEGIMPAFCPDGQRIAFSKLSAGKLEVWTINLDGTYPKQLVANGGHNIEACWSPSGRSLAYVSGESGFWKLWVVRDDGFPVAVTQGESNEGHPSWGAGGFLYFHSNAGFGSTRKIWQAKLNF